MKRVLLAIALTAASLLCSSCGLLGSMGQTMGRTIQSFGRLVTG